MRGSGTSMKKTLNSKRAWLNPYGHGHIVTSVTTTERERSAIMAKKHGPGIERDVDAVFDLADCSRIVSLDFEVYGPENEKKKLIAERRKKVRLLRDVVNSFADAYEQALDWLEETR